MKTQGLQIPVGNSVDLARVSGMFYVDATDHSSNATTETILSQYTLKANTFKTVNDVVKITAAGVSFGRSVQQTLRLYVAGTVVNTVTYTPVGDYQWKFDTEIIVTTVGASGVLRVSSNLFWNAGLGPLPMVTDITGVDTTATQLIKVTNATGSSGGTPYATEYTFLASFRPAP